MPRRRLRQAIDLGRAWARGEITWAEARTAAGHANAAARDLSGAARHAAYAAGQAAAVGHVRGSVYGSVARRHLEPGDAVTLRVKRVGELRTPIVA